MEILYALQILLSSVFKMAKNDKVIVRLVSMAQDHCPHCQKE